uniref:Uncharacterized protein n=1 Tax=Tetraselmis sp. GSL018 TaxID=582737 RepID=A0A061S0B0_9CHLO
MPLVVVIGKYLQMYPEINLERLYRCLFSKKKEATSHSGH